MSSISPSSFHLPGPLENLAEGVHDAASTVASDVSSAASSASAAISKTAGDVRASIGQSRPDAAFAGLTADVVKKLPQSMQDWLLNLPNVGRIGDETAMGKPALINDAEFGQSSAMPSILNVPVSPQKQGLLSVGQHAYQKCFAGYPPFDFNVDFSCAKADPLTGKSEYADPRSPWSNVFFGRYEIDAPLGKDGDATKWSRPFGFNSTKPGDINFDDILKLGNADWGYFSNWMYGVPDAALDKDLAMQAQMPKPTCTVSNPDVVIGGKHYVECEIDGAYLPSAFVNPKDGGKLTNNDSLMSPVWRQVFGNQPDGAAEDPAVAGTPSFAPTSMKMKFYVTQELKTDPKTGQQVYATEFYGGGVNKTWAGDDPAKQEYNEKFLDAQMNAVKSTMRGAPGS
jgi:hypothetical protein